MKNIKKLTNKLTAKPIQPIHPIHIVLIMMIVLLFLYIFNEAFRYYLLTKNIDPSFIIGFFTVIAILTSFIQNSYDKKFNYNMLSINLMRDKGMHIIAKLLAIKNKSEILLKTIKRHKEAIDQKQIYKDLNDTLSKKDIEDNAQLITAYIQVYFGKECSRWNELLKELENISSLNSGIVINYNENLKLIIEGKPFKNRRLDEIDESIKKAEKINQKIDKIAFEMSKKLVKKINDNTAKIKESFNFKL